MERIDYLKLFAAFLISLGLCLVMGAAMVGFYRLINIDVRAAAGVVVGVLIAIVVTPSIYRRIK